MTCVWCGAIALVDHDGSILWVRSAEMPPCDDHELLERPKAWIVEHWPWEGAP